MSHNSRKPGESDGGKQGEAATIEVPVPAADTRLYSRKATDPILQYLVNHPSEQLTLHELADVVDHSTDAVRRAVDVLEANGLVVVEASATARPVRINRDRLNLPDDPIFRIPQSEFHVPVREAVDRLSDELDDVLAIVLFGGVARGEADRKSDVDLWVLVDDRRRRNQERAHDVVAELAEETFDGNRYDYHVIVEDTSSVPSFTEDIGEILSTGIPLERSEEFEKFNQLIRAECSDE